MCSIVLDAVNCAVECSAAVNLPASFGLFLIDRHQLLQNNATCATLSKLSEHAKVKLHCANKADDEAHAKFARDSPQRLHTQKFIGAKSPYCWHKPAVDDGTDERWIYQSREIKVT
ncbi:MAG: hypothetical protein RMK18_06460 [Armatimonadota bacterium]|nr:hypothetical protein [Armatimonadota bacterium]MCX7778251.1 hypothetical protein [Armatimonadota bacterium]MDW8025489.1 hypothetical protein [Armatimonadota bacterium]